MVTFLPKVPLRTDKNRMAGMASLELDPGLKAVLKNGKVTVFVDQAVWITKESHEAVVQSLKGDLRLTIAARDKAQQDARNCEFGLAKAAKERNDAVLDRDAAQAVLGARDFWLWTFAALAFLGWALFIWGWVR